MKYYLAGGAVRNLLLGIKPTDFDFAFSGSEQEFIALNPKARKTGGPAILLGQTEYTPLRGKNPAEDINQRDFTINALLLDENGFLLMHPAALRDLQAGILEPVSPHALSDDPLRVFRAARFCAVFPHLQTSEPCKKLMRESAALEAFRGITVERVGQECLKAFSGPKPGNFLRVLGENAALTYWFVELSGASGIPAGPERYHKSDVLEHIATVMDQCVAEFTAWQKNQDDRQKNPAASTAKFDDVSLAHIRQICIWMALCHDLGKADTPAEILPHHYLHELRGIKAASDLAARLRLPERFRQAGMLASKLHMKAGIYPSLRPATRVDLLMEAQAKNLVVPLFLLAQADSGNSALLAQACAELELIKKIKLPDRLKNLGQTSGKRLRELRCQGLAACSRNHSKKLLI